MRYNIFDAYSMRRSSFTVGIFEPQTSAKLGKYFFLNTGHLLIAWKLPGLGSQGSGAAFLTTDSQNKNSKRSVHMFSSMLQ